jgi:hypothetical protein
MFNVFLGTIDFPFTVSKGKLLAREQQSLPRRGKQVGLTQKCGGQHVLSDIWLSENRFYPQNPMVLEVLDVRKNVGMSWDLGFNP